MHASSMDSICNKMGMCINASKTELMAYDPHNPDVLPSGVALSGGTAQYVQVFKYLGGLVNAAGGCGKEVRARVGKALGRFSQMKQLWGMKRMKVTTKMRCYNAYVLPILLFGCETWALTQQQLVDLERVHLRCLRQILGVHLSDRQTLEHIRKQCSTVSLADHIRAARLRWFGHVMRMEHGRIPHVVLFSNLSGASRPRGRPPKRWLDLVAQDLKELQLPTGMQELEAYCLMRGWWRSMVYKITHPESAGVRHQRSRGAVQRQQWRLSNRALQLQPSSAEQQAAVAEAWAIYYR